MCHASSAELLHFKEGKLFETPEWKVVILKNQK